MGFSYKPDLVFKMYTTPYTMILFSYWKVSHQRSQTKDRYFEQMYLNSFNELKKFGVNNRYKMSTPLKEGVSITFRDFFFYMFLTGSCHDPFVEKGGGRETVVGDGLTTPHEGREACSDGVPQTLFEAFYTSDVLVTLYLAS